MEAEETRRPVHHDALELGAGRRAGPSEAGVADGGGVDIGEDRGEVRVGGEVGEESGRRRESRDVQERSADVLDKDQK